MKKFRISILLAVAFIGVILYSCNKDDFSESDAMKLQAQLDKQRELDQDSLTTSTYRVAYTVNLVDASTSALKSASLVSAISGATVKFVQGDSIIVKTADASGIVAIGNVKPGMANVNITLADYSEVNYTVNLSASSINGSREVTNIIPLIPISGTATGTIQGKVTCESDLTNKTVEVVPAGTKILAMVKTSSAALPATGSNGIVSISYDKLSLQTTTDASGNYSLTVPATVSGLDYSIIVSDFTVNQTLLQSTYFNVDTTGVLTIPTNFGSSYLSASSVASGAPVIITVGAPDYTFTPAAATAVIDNVNGISNIQITSNGGGYSAPSGTYKVTVNSPVVTNKAVATLTLLSGRVSAISVTTPGSQYPATAENTAFSVPYVYDDVRAGVATVNGGGIVTLNIPANRRGVFYNTDTANILQTYSINGSGTGARVNFNFSWNGNGYWEVTSATVVTNPTGSGYAVGDTIGLKVRSGKANYMTGTLHMTSGSVTAISLSDQGANYISGKVDVIIGAPNILGGTTATATATVSNGKITAIPMLVANSGNGYTTPPTVTIVNKAEKSQAKFTATVSGGKVTAISGASGNGYLNVPSVSITSAIPGQGSGAAAYATVSGGVVSLTLVNQGNGYTGNNPSTERDFSGTSSLTIKGNTNAINNIDLGTGKRTIEQ